MNTRLLLAAVLAGALGACANSSASPGTAQTTADNVTKAVYDDSIDGVMSNLDENEKQSVSRGEIGTMSDQMHKLGDYKGLTFLNADASKSEFTYRADFSGGTANVVVRLDSDGKLSAYHVFIPKTT